MIGTAYAGRLNDNANLTPDGTSVGGKSNLTPKMKNITFDDWLKMSENERWKIHCSWNVYIGEGREIAEHVLEKFKEEFGKIEKLKISDKIGIYHGGTWALHVEHPFIFDKRKIPSTYLGIDVRGGASIKDMPKEFQTKSTDPREEYAWAPERFEKFVDRSIDQIRKELGNPNMSREEILDALLGSDFQKHIKHCKEWEKEGLIPKYRDKE